MIDKNRVAAFFDARAEKWDEYSECSRTVVKRLLDAAAVSAGERVLDVACGTGVLIPFYLERGVRSVTAIDISPKMIEKAREKYEKNGVRFLLGDASVYDFPERYDRIVVYNALPHFEDARHLTAHLSRALTPGGTLAVLHGAGKETVDRCHKGVPEDVSAPLPQAKELSLIIGESLRVMRVISDPDAYGVIGILD